MSDPIFGQRWENDLSRSIGEIIDKWIESRNPDKRFPSIETPPKDPPDISLARLIPHPSIIIALGHRGKG